MVQKRLLFVDDDEKRWTGLVEKLPEDIGFVSWVPSSYAAISNLREDIDYDVICLDHDLGPDDCGCKVVDWIVEHKDKFKNSKFIIHSWNPDGAEVMHLALCEAGLNSKRKMFHIL